MSESLVAFEALAEVRVIARNGKTIEVELEGKHPLRMARIWTLTVEEITAKGIFIRVGKAVHCFCGQKLHYVFPNVAETMENVCREKGEYAVVFEKGRAYNVPRHFIALHGLDYDLMEMYGFQRVRAKPREIVKRAPRVKVAIKKKYKRRKEGKRWRRGKWNAPVKPR